MYKFNYLVYIGRFQPFHNGHLHIIRKSLEVAEKVIVIVGSHNSAPSIRNPFPTFKRIEMIRGSLTPEENDRVLTAPQVDHTYREDRWIYGIQATVNSLIHQKWTGEPIKIGIVGYDKDHSSFYLKKFPQWELVSFDPYLMTEKTPASATFIRDMLWKHNDSSPLQLLIGDIVPEAVFKFLSEFLESHEFLNLKKEYDFIQKYKDQWKNTPYPVTFVTVDAVVVQSGHVLLVERGAAPGEGLWALPGGFIGVDETLLEATLRELREETKLAVPTPVLVGSVMKTKTFDSPHRSDRGRTITSATFFKLNDMETLPKIKGSDDARKAFWLPYSQVVNNRHNFYEDHYSILEDMIGF